MSKRKKIFNIIFVVIILLMVIPQTRNPIQVLIQKGVGMIVKPKLLSSSETQQLESLEWKLKNSKGKLFDLKNAEGKVLIINFWATWCPPCIAEMPSFQTLYNNYESDSNVVFLFISQEDKKVVKDFMVDKGYNLPHYRPISDYPALFNITSIPRTFIIDRNGNIVLDKSGVADWDSDEMRTIIDNLINAS